MNNLFYDNLERAYTLMQTKFNQFRESCERELSDDSITPVKISDSWTPSKNGCFNRRSMLELDKNYIVKFRPNIKSGKLKYVELDSHWERSLLKQEEKNVRTLRKYGITKENGFFIPEHKIVGMKIVNNIIEIDENGDGFTICENISEGGKYCVSDINPWLFYELKNGDEFLHEYKKNIDALLKVYNDPKISPSIFHHGTPENPAEPISKMLLSKILNNRGRIVIGDLDNIFFEEF